MSRRIRERAKELAEREAEIKRQLLGKADVSSAKIRRIGKMALVGGSITLIGYMVYKSFFQREENEYEENDTKPRKVKKSSSKMNERLLTFALPYLARFLERVLSEGFSPKKEEEIATDEKTDSNKLDVH